jgi:hypothetical protein
LLASQGINETVQKFCFLFDAIDGLEEIMLVGGSFEGNLLFEKFL